MRNRIKTALEYLKDGQSFKIGDLRLSINEQNCLLFLAGLDITISQT